MMRLTVCKNSDIADFKNCRNWVGSCELEWTAPWWECV